MNRVPEHLLMGCLRHAILKFGHETISLGETPWRLNIC
jgi:hypothetical protein